MSSFASRVAVVLLTFCLGVAATVWSVRRYLSSKSSPPQPTSVRAIKPQTISQTDESLRFPEYKVGRAIRSASEQNKLYLFISIEPQYFVRDKMVSLAGQLNQDFKQEPRLLAVILDDEGTARNSAGVANELELFQKAERGSYFLDRTTGEEYIEFSAARGKPQLKVVLGEALSNKGMHPTANSAALIR